MQLTRATPLLHCWQHGPALAGPLRAARWGMRPTHSEEKSDAAGAAGASRVPLLAPAPKSAAIMACSAVTETASSPH
jgi:hypothetical protein